MGVHWKIQLLPGEFTKNRHREGGLPEMEGAWTVCRFKGRGAWQEGLGGVFEGGCIDTLMHTMAF